MGLESYNELREKVVNQMHDQAMDVKTVMVEQWAKNNGFENVAFNNYDEAKEWVNENINKGLSPKKMKQRKNFCNFEAQTNDILNSIMQDLEEGSSSDIMRRIKHISNKYVTPAAKVVLKSVIISQATHLAVSTGLTVGGNILHIKALDKLGEVQDALNAYNVNIEVPKSNLAGKVTSAPKSVGTTIPHNEARGG